jgi:phospholipid/cholesterol/gamma-HCH transport system substrate-binding protein
MKTQHILKLTHNHWKINDGKGTVGLLLNDAEVARDLKKIMYYLKISEEKQQRKI